eukprot:Ihof_evm5s311 gene=Ihof_evmTU5s311
MEIVTNNDPLDTLRQLKNTSAREGLPTERKGLVHYADVISLSLQCGIPEEELELQGFV